MQNLHHHLQSLFRWHLTSSTLFELSKALHQAALFSVLPATQYGSIATIFSLIYLCASLCSLQAGNALIAHAPSIAHSPHRTQILTSYLLFPQLIIESIGALATHITITSKLLPLSSPLLITIILITISEGLRLSIRPLAYTITDSTTLIPTELALTIGYFVTVWQCWLFTTLTIEWIIYPFFAMSLAGLFYITYALYTNQTHIPQPTTITPPTIQSNITARLILTALQLPKNFLSANLLVPFFAQSGGLALAGTIKITSEIATGLKSIITSAIGFSTNTILTTYKEHQVTAFKKIKVMAKKLIIATSIMVSTGVIGWYLWKEELFSSMMMSAFCGLAILEYLFIAYEHIVIATHTHMMIVQYRIIEVGVSTLWIIAAPKSPILIAGGLVLIRSISLYTSMRYQKSREHTS